MFINSESEMFNDFVIIKELISLLLEMTDVVLEFMNPFIDGCVINHH